MGVFLSTSTSSGETRRPEKAYIYIYTCIIYIIYIYITRPLQKFGRQGAFQSIKASDRLLKDLGGSHLFSQGKIDP